MPVFYWLFVAFLLFSCVKSFENTEICQKRAIKDCSAKLSEVFQCWRKDLRIRNMINVWNYR